MYLYIILVGEFGAVQKGVLLLDDNGSQAEHLVAVKTLKGKTFNL